MNPSISDRLPAASNTAPLAYLGRLKRHWSSYVEVGAASLVINICGLLLPLFSSLVYDKVIGNGNNETLWTLALGILLFIAIEFVLRNLRSHVLARIAAASDLKSERLTLQRILESSSQKLGPAGALISRYRDHYGARETLFSQYAVAAVDLPFLLLFLLALFFMGGHLVWVQIIMGILLLGGSFLLQRPIRDYGAKFNANSSRKTALLAEIIAAVDVVKSGDRRPEIEDRWTLLAESGAQLRGSGRFWQTIAQAWSAFCITLSSVLTLLAGVYLVDSGTMSVGLLISCSLINLRAMSSMSSVAGLVLSWRDLIQARDELDGALPTDRSSGDMPEPALVRGEIVAQGLTCALETSRAILEDIGFHVRSGEKVGIVGKPGSGKSTLLRHVGGLAAPSRGQILVDDTSILSFSSAARSRLVAYKPQDPVLFEGTLGDNLRPGNAPDTGRWKAVLDATGLSESFLAGELRLDQHVEARGTNLSGGQRQLVALAHALGSPRPVYLLDEPTAGVDSETEERIAQAVIDSVGRSTLLVATHSRAMLAKVDRIIVLDRGRIVADGPRDQILR